MQHDNRSGGLRARTDATVTAKKCCPQRAGNDFGFDAGSPFKTREPPRSAQSAVHSTSRSRIAGAHPGQDFPKPRFAKSRRRKRSDSHTFHMLARIAEEDSVLRSAFEWCGRAGRTVGERDSQRSESIARAIRFNRRKISLRHPAGKHLQTLHPTRESPRDQQRNRCR